MVFLLLEKVRGDRFAEIAVDGHGKRIRIIHLTGRITRCCCAYIGSRPRQHDHNMITRTRQPMSKASGHGC